MVRNVLARSVYCDGEIVVRDGGSDDENAEREFIRTIEQELAIARQDLAVDMSDSRDATMDYVRRLQAKLMAARAGAAGTNKLLKYYRLQPWFTSADRLAADKKRLLRVIDQLKSTLVDWEEAR